jgi:hypothetical protein
MTLDMPQIFKASRGAKCQCGKTHMQFQLRRDGAWGPPACPSCMDAREPDDPEPVSILPTEAELIEANWRRITPTGYLDTDETRLDPATFAKISAWARQESPKPWLLLLGRTRARKSRQAALALKFRALSELKRCGWVNAAKLSSAAQRQFGHDGAGYQQLLAGAESAPVLVLDDLGKEHGSPVVQTAMYSLINQRFERKLTTIVTSQYSGEQLARMYSTPEDGAAIVARLREACERVQCREEKE